MLATDIELSKLGYGLGTANYKGGKGGGISRKIVDDTVVAIKAGWYHLDGAEGWSYDAADLHKQ